MPQEIIPKKTKADLEILTKEAVFKNFYLAGGTGAALQLKHRVSLDLDFFTKKDIDTKALIQKIKTLGKFSIEKETKNTLIGVFNGTRVSFLKYAYPLLFDLKQIKEIKVADLRDIGCMKIDAISSRGIKSLAYFEDAENNPMPRMTVPASWQEIKSFFKEEIRKINNK